MLYTIGMIFCKTAEKAAEAKSAFDAGMIFDDVLNTFSDVDEDKKGFQKGQMIVSDDDTIDNRTLEIKNEIRNLEIGQSSIVHDAINNDGIHEGYIVYCRLADESLPKKERKKV